MNTSLRFTVLAVISLAVVGCNKTEPASTSPSASQTRSEPEKAPTKAAPSPGAQRAAQQVAIAAPPTDEPAGIPAPDDVAAAPESATTTESGLAYRVLEAGTGEAHPREFDSVSVHYTGWTTDGEMFDSSVVRGEPATFPLNGVIPGWTEGVQLMVVGEKARFWIPVELAYNNRPGRPAGMLIFDIELLSIQEGTAPPEVPSDVAEPPSNAQRTESGLRYRVLEPGTGTAHPSETDGVEVHYTGWTTDGQMFDSSVTRGQPATFPLNRVIPGWTEGVQLMVAGEKTRFWIPVELAYNGRPGAPPGMLVFDIQLISIAQ